MFLWKDDDVRSSGQNDAEAGAEKGRGNVGSCLSRGLRGPYRRGGMGEGRRGQHHWTGGVESP